VKIRANIQKHLMIVALAVICSVGFAAVAQAENLTIGDSRYLGSIDPGTPSSPAAEVGFINHLIDLALGTQDNFFDGNTYDRSNVSCGACTDAVLAGSFTDENAPFNPINLGSGWLYLLGKYGNTSHVWLVSGLTGTGHTIPDSIGEGGGLSHYALFNPGGTQVPEPSSLLLLGSAMAAIGAATRLYRR
jgi:hypothetical protein